MLNPSHKAKHDLLTKMNYIRNTDGGLVVQRNYTYDKLGRPLTRQTLRSGGAMNETFDYNDRSEIIHATRTVGDSFDYAYDNIGNRVTAQEVNSGATSDVAYVTNDLNQYTQIDTNSSDFTPEYDADGNQTLIQTETGIWSVTYNVQNRAVRFENESSGTVITCDYDYLGRRVFKKVEKDGVVTAHERYLYRDYLQIASLDMMEGQNQALINAYVWDPTQPVATCPLAIFYKGSAYYYGWDLTKNITEIFSLSARLQIDYVYTPFGQVRENGIIQQSARRLAGRLDKSAAFAPKGRGADGAAVSQSVQWSSEYHDAETGLVYYNYRYYNPRDGRWTRRDIEEFSSLGAMYGYLFNSPTGLIDLLGHRSQNSGTPPRYNPANWNDEDTGGRYQWANNCYSYACDIRYDGNKINPSLRDYDGGYRPRPGEASGQGRKVKMNCEDIMRRATGDGLYILHEKCCKRGYHKVALVVGPEDFHWYRQDQGGMWSHKPGIDKVRNTDALGRPISNPEKADWGSLYDTFCGYMCAPDF